MRGNLDELVISDAMRLYGNTILRIATSVVGNRTDAEDVFIDVFFTLWKQNKSFESEEHKKAWLIRVAINKAKNVSKQAYNRYKASLCENHPSPEIEPEIDLQKALNLLKPLDRIIMFLHYYEGYTYCEVGKLMGMRENTVRSNAQRAREKMKNFLSKV